MWPSPILRALAEQAEKPKYDINSNPYRAKKTWPPVFEELNSRHQFRLERRYRRRSKLKWARPTWNKWVKVTQLGSIVVLTVYGVLFMDWKQQHEPFVPIRRAFHEMTGGIFTSQERYKPRRDAGGDATPAVSERRQ